MTGRKDKEKHKVMNEGSKKAGRQMTRVKKRRREDDREGRYQIGRRSD